MFAHQRELSTDFRQMNLRYLLNISFIRTYRANCDNACRLLRFPGKLFPNAKNRPCAVRSLMSLLERTFIENKFIGL